MCASDAEHTAVTPLDVPPGCKPGDRVWFGPAYEGEPLAEINTKKSKLLELILKDCVTDAGEPLVPRVVVVFWCFLVGRLAFSGRRPHWAPLSFAHPSPPLFPFPPHEIDGNPTFKGERAITTSGPVTSTMPNAHVG
jgi:hypothetical protein